MIVVDVDDDGVDIDGDGIDCCGGDDCWYYGGGW